MIVYLRLWYQACVICTLILAHYMIDKQNVWHAAEISLVRDLLNEGVLINRRWNTGGPSL